jgi:hypothetical protein
MGNSVFRATLLCATLDGFYATIMSVLRGGEALNVWLGVASGPFGDGANQWGWAGGLIGVGVHFAIMAVMVAVFFFAHDQIRAVRYANPWLVGTLYGLLLYGVMNFIVLALRFPANFPPNDPVKIAIALFPHIAFVGIPLALMARRAR